MDGHICITEPLEISASVPPFHTLPTRKSSCTFIVATVSLSLIFTGMGSKAKVLLEDGALRQLGEWLVWEPQSQHGTGGCFQMKPEGVVKPEALGNEENVPWLITEWPCLQLLVGFMHLLTGSVPTP